MKNILIRAAALILAVICVIPLSACGRDSTDGDGDGIHGDDNGKTTDGIYGDDSRDGTMTDDRTDITNNNGGDGNVNNGGNNGGDSTDDGVLGGGNESGNGSGNNIDPKLGIGTDGGSRTN